MPLRSSRSHPGTPVRGQDTLSIRDFYRQIERALNGALTGEVWISGEVRSLNVSSKGLCYIDLVDPVHARDNASPVLKVVCWSRRWATVRNTLAGLGIVVETGMVVRVRGAVQLYQPRGEVSLVLSELDTDALVGKVAAERARLIKALVDEDLFESNRRVPVPSVPLRVGLVASPGTEGHRDFMGCLAASGMSFAVQAIPTQVQGRAAVRSVASALRRLQVGDRDLIVVVRGGGSKADLAIFDAEPVARAIALCSKPVWTGIGHTGDQSVADQVANRSFITPTECGQELARQVTSFWRSHLDAGAQIHRLAGERVARSERGIDRHRHRVLVGAGSQLGRHSDRLAHRTQALRGSAKGAVESHRHRLEAAGAALIRSALRSLESEEVGVASRSARLATRPDRRLDAEGLRTTQWRRLLGAYDFQRQLDRGYSVTRDATGRVVRSSATLSPGSLLFTRLAEGSAVSAVTDASDEGDPGGPAGSPDRTGESVSHRSAGSTRGPEGKR
ncbi:MAG: exodeoxyribonuclease VII large subunit [Acidimicrobiales bacterium]